MSWISFCVLALAATALLMVPGTIVNRCARLSWHTSLGLAPAISTAIIAVSAILGDRVGISWNLLPPTLLTLFLSLSFVMIVTIWRPHQNAESQPPRRAINDRPSIRWWLIGGIVGMGVMGWRMVNIVGDPDNFSQNVDNLYHLNVVRWILDSSNGSSLTTTMTSGDGSPSFYPMAWHDLASLVLKLSNSGDVAAGVNAMVVIVPSLIWVLGNFYLLWTMRHIKPVALISAGFLVAAFPSFPYVPSSWGPLYPNVLGLALIPSVVAFTIEVLGLTPEKIRLYTGIPVALIACLGMALAHPNTFALYSVFLIPLLAIQTLQIIRSSNAAINQWHRIKSLLLFGIVLIFVIVVWKYVRPAEEAAIWPPHLGWRRAIWQAVTLSTTSFEITVLPAAILTAIGLLALVLKRQHIWLLIAHFTFISLWMIVAAFPWGTFRTALVGIWYNDATRLAAALPLTALPLSIIGVSVIGSSVSAFFNLHRHAAAAYRKHLNMVSQGAIIALISPLILFNSLLAQVLSSSASTYRISPDSNLVDTDEYTLINELHSLVEFDEGIATIPSNGSSLAYALTGIPTTTTHITYTPTEDITLINTHLSSAQSDPRICQAVDRLNIKYALDFGTTEVNGWHYTADYPGFAGLDQAPGFTPVASSGHAVLYRIDACG